MVETFTYLGSTLSIVGHIDNEVNARIYKARQYLANYVEVFGIKVELDDTKVNVYRSVVLPLLYPL